MALWGELEVRLACSLRVVAFDPRGVGESSDVPFGHSTRDMARDAVSLLDALAIPRAHVFGLSLGGMVASWIAIDAPDRVERLVLASTLPRASAVSRRALSRGVLLARCLVLPGAHAEVALVRAVLSREFRKRCPERVREIGRLVLGTPAKRRNLLLFGLAAARHDAARELRNVRARTLLLFGALDPVARRTSRLELLHAIPNATLAIVPRAGHDVSLEAPAATASAVIDFVANP
jgi:pimeloyl-ACP methyl ester carboxylesterase